MKTTAKVRVGVVGAGGGAGSGMVRTVLSSEETTLVAVAEVAEEKRKRLLAELTVPVYQDYRELLAREDIDLVVNSTPNFVHAEVAIAALNSGKYVFSEKPMGMNPAEISAILQAERESGRVCQINFEMRYSLMSRRIREIIEAGEIGEVMNIHFVHNCGGVGFVKKPGDWRGDPAMVGGYFIEEGCHRLDLFRYYMGLDPESVLAVPAPNLRGPDGWHRGYREPACTLCFFPGGKLAQLTTIQHLGVHPVETPGMEPELGHEYGIKVVGSEGGIRADFWRSFIQIVYFAGREGNTRLKRTESYQGLALNSLHHDSRGFFMDFVKRIRKAHPPFMTAADSARTMAVVFACESSLLSGQPVPVDYTFIPG
ncbi:MAG TPA: Gfo/Idh/MocA family oxidoreductase [bacterium]|nr:Gfo/Idh/MocA family oxidoreductase [bacterium]HOL66714.1 Gfo/Idh/MocA family oxidoreductase [bacterium]HPP11805.1 Gfo/Idh/MocA family oxidoreductase [bacterium]